MRPANLLLSDSHDPPLRSITPRAGILRDKLRNFMTSALNRARTLTAILHVAADQCRSGGKNVAHARFAPD